MNEEDREFILDILNYEFTDILKSLGFNTDGGKFVYAKKEGINPSQHIDIVTKLNAMGLPMDDDYLYETFAVRKPANYDEIKKAKEEQKKALQLAFSASEEPKQSQKEEKEKSFKQQLMDFFGLAPQDQGANSEDW